MISRLPFAIRSTLSSSPLHLHRSVPIAATSAAIGVKPYQTPLFLRPLVHSVAASELSEFRRWARGLAEASGPLLVGDGGPDSAHLLRELSWFLKDVSSVSETQQGDILMRTTLDELYGLWRERIEERRPFQYIVGSEHWRDLVLVVREGVLIPRPETEMLVDLVAEVEGFKRGWWADLGTGSGAIAIGIGRKLVEGGRVIATDVSMDAVELAGFNVERYGLKEKVEVRQGSWFEPLEDVKGKLAGVLSNPPYIPSSHISGLQEEVGRHEPRLALDGGDSGMDYLLHLCEGSASALKHGGFFAFETNGDEQSEFIANYLRTDWVNCFHNVKIVLDFAGIKRFVTGFRR